jgi:sugar (pentulose or hexulose) kinase
MTTLDNTGMGQTFIGIDLGTTFLKGAVLDLDAVELTATTRNPFPDFVHGLPASRREVDSYAVVGAVRVLIRQLLPQAGDCQGIVMCTQMHGLVLTDATGHPLTNTITWQDQRTLEPHPTQPGSCYDVMSRLISIDDRIAVGNDLWASRPLSFLFWMLAQAQAGSTPDPFAAILVDKSGHNVVPASLPDFVLANICHTAPSTDITNAAAYGVLDLNTQDWRYDVIEKLQLDQLLWPRIRRHGEIVGQFEIDGVKLPCYTPVGDHQCAVLGTLLREDELSINVSTGSQVGLLTSALDLSSDYETRPYFDGNYLKAIIHIPAGRALNALLRLLCEMAEAQGITIQNPWDYIARAVSTIEQSHLRANLAFFPSSCGDVGEITNIHEEDLTVGNLFAAAFENMAENYLQCADRISRTRAWRRLVFSGGLVQKLEPLQQAIIKKFAADYRFAPSSEDTLLGLLVLALAFSGKAQTVADAIQTVSHALNARLNHV